jgi:hypothetical protein
MPDISQIPPEERMEASGERGVDRPDLREAPENPPVDQQDFERGKDKLQQVLAK